MARQKKLTAEDMKAYLKATQAVQEAVNEWQDLRRQVVEDERHEHPPITDKFGRVWVWKRHDLYTHDDTLALPGEWLRAGRVDLPRPGLADVNPNYQRLCAICNRSAPKS